MKPKLLLLFIAWCKGGTVVWLQDDDGEYSQSIAYRDPEGNLFCYRWWPWDVHFCSLLPDGSIKQHGGQYVNRWGRFK